MCKAEGGSTILESKDSRTQVNPWDRIITDLKTQGFSYTERVAVLLKESDNSDIKGLALNDLQFFANSFAKRNNKSPYAFKEKTNDLLRFKNDFNTIVPELINKHIESKDYWSDIKSKIYKAFQDKKITHKKWSEYDNQIDVLVSHEKGDSPYNRTLTSEKLSKIAEKYGAVIRLDENNGLRNEDIKDFKEALLKSINSDIEGKTKVPLGDRLRAIIKKPPTPKSQSNPKGKAHKKSECDHQL